ncbi:MAG: alginate lyase family protein [Opitutaceae bacterium]|nr:alginate lyase family protein [Opitutaceae bacterium]
MFAIAVIPLPGASGKAQPPALPDQRHSLVVGWQWSDRDDGYPPFRLDARHANIAGRHLPDCVFYEGLFGGDARPLTFVPEGLAPSDAAGLRRIAHAVVPGKHGQTAVIAGALARPVCTVVDKSAPPGSGDLHDYVSYARYYWPDPAKPGGLPYIARDGESNEAQVARGDHGRLWTFFDTVDVLATAWRDNRDAACAQRAGEWLRAWLVTPATRMNPNLEYAQVRPGHDGDRGSNYGIIDTRGFGQIIANIRMLRDSGALSPEDGAALRKWFSAYLDWLVTSQNGIAERAMKSNHGTWYVAQALPIACHVARLDLAREFCEETKARIAVQIAPDGSQPIDIKRVDGLGYSHFNLRAHAQIARAARDLGVDFWNYTAPNGASLRRAVAFLAPYNDAPEKWPYSQKAKLAPGFLNALLREMEEMEETALAGEGASALPHSR